MSALRLCCWLLLLLLWPAALLAGSGSDPVSAAPYSPATASAPILHDFDPAVLYQERNEPLPALMVAHNTGAEKGSGGGQKQEVPECSWSTFREVHFGGYRWVWWALAGGALIAIHAD